MIASYRLIIPTRDSAAWIGKVLSAYRQIGVEPLYVVDARSKDETLELLHGLKADCVPFTPRGDIVEAGMIEFGSRAAGADWVLRLDDDEFPSRKLLDWVAEIGTRSSVPFWVISRRDICLRDEGFVYSRWPTRRIWNGGRFSLNPQVRLYRVHAVRYIERVHTPGFEAPPPHAYAPEDCFFVHFNNVLRSARDRLLKVRKYAAHDEQLAWRYADECLPELTNPVLHDYASDGLDEFSSLLKSLPSPMNDATCAPTESERMLAAQEMQAWLVETARATQETICASQETIAALQEAVSAMEETISATQEMVGVMREALRVERETFWPRFVPQPLLRPLTELLLTLGRRLDSRTLSDVGLRAWNFQKLRALV